MKLLPFKVNYEREPRIGFNISKKGKNVKAEEFMKEIKNRCCSNHSSLKDKWSHNQQSSPVGYQVTNGGITRELDKEPSLHCFSIYINYMWSVLQQYLLALMSIPLPHVLLLIHHKATMLYTCALISYSLISIVHVCTMCIPWGTLVSWCYS